MKQWDIVDVSFAHPIGLHPAVVLSPDQVAGNPDVEFINVLIVTTVRAGHVPGRFDVMLNGADGLEHLSRTRVLPIMVVRRTQIGRLRGALSSIRRAATARKIRESFLLG